MILRARQFEFRFPRPTLVMGILNVTPDSFSDGGQYLDADAAVAHGLRLVEAGADILDVGGESTRPNAVPVPEDEELRRVIPVVERLAREVRVPISIDTMKPAVAAAALEVGAAIVNDVGANREDDSMWRLVALTGAGYVCMHMKGTPQTMQAAPSYRDVSSEVRAFLVDRLNRLRDCEVRDEQVIVDIGIGFGKTAEHNIALLAALSSFKDLGRPLALGVSRKGFISAMTGAAASERLAGSLACAVLAAEQGVEIIRVHDVKETVQALRMCDAIRAHKRC